MNITLCADDFGQDKPICRGILHLAERGIVSATSCMSNMPLTRVHIPELLHHKAHTAIGLHLNLTQGEALSPGFQLRPLRHWLVLTHLNALSKGERANLADEIERQIDALLTLTDGALSFIDGHQHVHHLPIVRTLLLKAYHARFPDKKVSIRSCIQPNYLSLNWASRFKASVIRHSGAQALRHMLRTQGIPHNEVFGGIYAFSSLTSGLPQIMSRVRENTLIMCHPALYTDEDVLPTDDPLHSIRASEYVYLSTLNSPIVPRGTI